MKVIANELTWRQFSLPEALYVITYKEGHLWSAEANAWRNEMIKRGFRFSFIGSSETTIAQRKEYTTMRAYLLFAAIMVASPLAAQEHSCDNSVTCNNGSINKSDTSNSQSIGDHLDNTYAPDSSSSSSTSGASVGDVIAQGGTGGNSSATGANLNNSSNASNNLSNQQIGGHATAAGGNATGGSVNGSGNSSSYAKGGEGGSVNGSGNSQQAQGQQQGQNQSSTASSSTSSNQKTKVGGQKAVNKQKVGGQKAVNKQKVGGQKTKVGGQKNSTKVDARDQSDYEAAASTAMVTDAMGTAPCAKVNSLAVQTIGAGAGIRFDRESGNCWAERRADQIAYLSDNDTALLYLAQQDPALWAVMVAQGKIAPAPRQDSNPLRQAKMPVANIVSGSAEPVCRVKDGTARTVVTNWSDKMACARKLGL